MATAMAIRAETITEELERDGYAVIREVFSTEEIVHMREQAAALVKGGGRSIGGLVKAAPIESDLGRRLLGEPRLAFPGTGELPHQIHVHADTFNDWHAELDPLPQAAETAAEFAWMYKGAIYLQDHSERDGLSVVPESHRAGSAPRVPVHVHTRAGDVILFHQSIRHAGRVPNSLLLNLSRGMYRLRLLEDHGRLFWIQHLVQPKPAHERIASFAYYSPMRRLFQPKTVHERISIFFYYMPMHHVARRYADFKAQVSYRGLLN